MATSATNRKNIKKNRRTIFEVEATVTSYRAKAYASRSIIEENRAMILKNYTAAFMGNRQLANQNTDDVFRNRQALIATVDAESDVLQNFKESLRFQHFSTILITGYLQHDLSENSNIAQRQRIDEILKNWRLDLTENSKIFTALKIFNRMPACRQASGHLRANPATQV